MRRYLLQKSIFPPIHSLPPRRVHRRYGDVPAPFRQDAEPRQFRLFPASAEALHHLQALRRDFAHAPAFQCPAAARSSGRMGARRGSPSAAASRRGRCTPLPAAFRPSCRGSQSSGRCTPSGSLSSESPPGSCPRRQSGSPATARLPSPCRFRSINPPPCPLRARRAAAGVPAVSAASASDSPCAPGLSAASG